MANEQRPIRVMIVDDVLETRENLRKLLQFEPNVQIVGEAATGQEAIQIAKERKPDVIIMDIHLPDMNGLEATEEIRKILPATQVVILTVQGDMEYMRRAMMVGARDFLMKPPSIDELLDAVRRAAQVAWEEQEKIIVAQETGPLGMRPPETLGKIITVFSPKGGVGKSVLAVNLAVALQTPDTTVHVVDAKWAFGDVALLFNEQATHNLGELTEEIDIDILSQVLLVHSKTGIRILAAPTRPAESRPSPEQFGRILELLRNLADYIVVDTGPPLEPYTLTALENSDLVLLVFEQDVIAVRNVRVALDFLASDIPRERILLILNRFDKRKGISPERLEQFFRLPIHVIPEDKWMPHAVNRGEILVRTRRNAPATQGILNLMREVRERLLQQAQV